MTNKCLYSTRVTLNSASLTIQFVILNSKVGTFHMTDRHTQTQKSLRALQFNVQQDAKV